MENTYPTAVAETAVAPQETMLRCPYCHVPFEIPQDTVSRQITCARCEHHFGIVLGDAIVPTTTAIGPFQPIERLGMDAYGEVWKAHDAQLDRVVALIVTHKARLAPVELEELLRQAGTAARLKHPHIASVHDVGRGEDAIYIARDFIDGESLAETIKRRTFASQEVAEICHQVARALHHAHESGVMHGHLHSGNVLIDSRGRARVADFGLAKRSHAADVVVSIEGRVLGAPAYLAPEQVRQREDPPDRCSDIYALGVLLFELLTNELPFRGRFDLVVAQVARVAPPSPRKLNDAVTRDLETICLKCLEKDPARRYPTACDVEEELQRFLEGQPLHTRPLTRMQRARRLCYVHPRASTVVALASALVILLMAGITFAYLRAQNDRQRLDKALRDEEWLRQAYLRHDGLKPYQDAVERAANDPAVVKLISASWGDGGLSETRQRLYEVAVDEVFDAARHRELRERLVHIRARKPLQNLLEQQYGLLSSADVLAWFVLDEMGTQIARAPESEAIGKNFAWRTYFNGNQRDSTDLEDFLRHGSRGRGWNVHTTHLTRVLKTRPDGRRIVAISTPVFRDQNFLAVIGVLVALPPRTSY